MNTCKSELVRGLVVQGAGVAGIGTAIDIASLFVGGTVEDFNEITVFNDGSDVVRVQWTNDASGEQEDFMVPQGGKSFSRSLNRGNIAPASLKVYALSDTVALTGNLTINLGKH